MKIKTIKLSLLLGVLILMVMSCNPARKWQKEEDQSIQDYLGGLGDTVYIKKPSGLIVIELVPGTGRLPITYDTVSIRYKGSLMDGRVFASNANETEPLTFIAGTGDLMDGYNRLIEGLSEGVLYIKEGGKSRLITPSSLAYGERGTPDGRISGYTAMRWEIEVVSVKAGPAK
jgi:FKBP-type peptidyl-prolyl cis-trans isomerase FkpA